MTSPNSSDPLSCDLIGDEVLIDGKLRIAFHRTIRVPDNQETSWLPPSLGNFELKPVSKYLKTLPAEMAAKGGLFLPMYRKFCERSLCSIC